MVGLNLGLGLLLGSNAGGGVPVTFNPAMGLVNSLWAGTPTADGAYISARLASNQTASLWISTAPNLNAVGVLTVASASSNGTLRQIVTGLQPATTYYYGVAVNGVVDSGKIGKFVTAPVANAATSFRFAASSCAQTGSTLDTYDTILGRSPVFMLHMGDIQYWDSTSTSVATRRGLFDTYLALAKAASFHRGLNVVYTYDDHDTAGDNCYSASTGMAAARDTFREIVPVPANSAAGGHNGYSFIYGRVKFIVPDLRSQRSIFNATDDAAKTMLGSAQKTWFKAELDAAVAANQVVVFVSAVPWLGTQANLPDGWGGYQTERLELADYMKASGLQGSLIVLSGDLHAVAWGTVDYATGGGMAIDVFQAAPLDRTSSDKGGPFLFGPSYSATQFGEFNVTDSGGGITFAFEGITAAGAVVSGSARTVTLKAPGAAAAVFDATGGTVTTPGDGYKYWTFNASDTLNVTSFGNVEYLVVAGGGGGARTSTGGAGGGGGGGLKNGTLINLSAGSYAITVGSGGAAGTFAGGGQGANGTSSSLSALVVTTGGGRGATPSSAASNGGSGGGGGASTTAVGAGTGSAGQGSAGGIAYASATQAERAGGGGGGSGGTGNAATLGAGGNGGSGLTVWGVGYSGGGGGFGQTSPGAGGSGGGDAAAINVTPTNPPANRGGGGGAGGGTSVSAAPGGSGVIILRRPV